MHHLNNKKISTMIAAAAWASLALTSGTSAITTTWIGTAGNGLWSDPTNWSTGVPQLNDTARFGVSSPVGVIDLGGVQRSTSTIRIDVAGITFANGTLNTSLIMGNASAPPTLISANLLGGSQLILDLTGLEVNGAISGPGTTSVSRTTTFSAPSTRDGAVTLSAPLQLNNAGAIGNAPLIVSRGSPLRLNYGSSNQVNKLNDVATFDTWRGPLEVSNHSAGAVTETLGAMSMLKGANRVTLSTDSFSAPLVLHTDFVRNLGATLYMGNDPTLATRIVSDHPIATGGSGQQRQIVPWMIGTVGSRFSFVTYDAGPTADPSDDVGYRPLDPSTEYASTITPNANVRLAGPQALSTDATTNALTFHTASAGVQFSNNAQLTIAQGALAMSAPDAPVNATVDAFSGNGRLNAGGGELVVWTDPASVDRFRIAVPITAGAIAKAGAGTLALTRANTIANEVLVNEGTLVASAAGALGGANAIVRVAGGSLRFEGESQKYGTLMMDQSLGISGSPVISAFSLVVDSGLTITFDHVAGTGQISKPGAGRLRIAGDSATTYGATIFMVAGSVQLDGRYEGLPVNGGNIGAFIQGNANTLLLGSGTFLGTVLTSIAPGDDAPGRFTLDTVRSSGQTTLFTEIAGAAPATGYDQLVVLTALTLTDRSLDVDLLNGFTPTLGSQFTILDDQFAGAITGAFTGLAQGAVFFADGRAFQIDYLGRDGNDVVLTAVVPEPSSLIFVFAPLAAIAFSGSRRRRLERDSLVVR